MLQTAPVCRTERIVRTSFHILCLAPAAALVVLWSLPHDLMGAGAQYFGFSILLAQIILLSSGILSLIGFADIVACLKLGRGLPMAMVATILAATPGLLLVLTAWGL